MIKNGNFVKAKVKFLKEKFQTREGLFDFFVGSFIWGFLIIEFNKVVFDFLLNFFSFIPIFVVQKYVAYLIFALVTSTVGIIITLIVNRVYEFILGLIKNS